MMGEEEETSTGQERGKHGSLWEKVEEGGE